MAAQTNAPLPDGTQMAGYRIVKKIAAGGFSIVYLAHDEQGRELAIKEYLPSNLVERKAGALELDIAPENLSTFRIGLKCFFEEGRALARIVHPQVVAVVNFFRANDTVYMVMEHEAGRSLQDYVLRRRALQLPRLTSERFIRNVFGLVMGGLREVHAHKLLHLDIKPANIYLRSDGTPMLLDFGAARQIQKIDVIRPFPMFTPGFAAPELYAKNGKLGPWTDIYGLGASMYACMAGTPPQAADVRRNGDQMTQRVNRLARLYSPELLQLVRWCLELDPSLRPHSVFALQKALRATAPPLPVAGWGRRIQRLTSELLRAVRPH